VGGLVVRNSIILIDYIYERMKARVELEQAALEPENGGCGPSSSLRRPPR